MLKICKTMGRAAHAHYSLIAIATAVWCDAWFAYEFGNKQRSTVLVDCEWLPVFFLGQKKIRLFLCDDDQTLKTVTQIAYRYLWYPNNYCPKSTVTNTKRNMDHGRLHRLSNQPSASVCTRLGGRLYYLVYGHESMGRIERLSNIIIATNTCCFLCENDNYATGDVCFRCFLRAQFGYVICVIIRHDGLEFLAKGSEM